MVKRKYECPECQATFRRRVELQHHRREERNQGRPNMCPVCKKSFSTEQQLKMHSLHHNVGGQFHCYYCNKEFNKAWKLKIHHVNHTGRLSYLCKICRDDFLYPGKLVYHMKHIHELWHCCRECGDAFQNYHQLQVHECKIYGCKDCTLWFESQKQLTEHFIVHTDTKEVAVADEVKAVSGHSEVYKEAISNSGTDQSPSVTDLPQSSHDYLQPCSVAAVKLEPAAINDQSISATISSGSSSNGVFRQNPAISVTPRQVTVSHKKELDGNHQHTGSNAVVTDRWVPKESSSVMVKTCIEPRSTSDNIRSVQSRLNAAICDIFKEHTVDDSESSCTKPKFKVPASKVLSNKKKHSEGVCQSFPPHQVDTNKPLTRQESLLQKLHIYVDADARLTEKNKASFETWLYSDTFPSTSHDFVFGFESAPGNVCEAREKQQQQYFHHKTPQKVNGEMTFEDLCKF